MDIDTHVQSQLKHAASSVSDNSNLGCVLQHFQDTATFRQKITFPHTSHLTPLLQLKPFEFLDRSYLTTQLLMS